MSINPFKKKPEPVHIDKLQTEPYKFEPGQVYVIEVDISKIEKDNWQDLETFLANNNINAKLVATMNGQAIRPVSVKTVQRLVQ